MVRTGRTSPFTGYDSNVQVSDDQSYHKVNRLSSYLSIGTIQSPPPLRSRYYISPPLSLPPTREIFKTRSDPPVSTPERYLPVITIRPLISNTFAFSKLKFGKQSKRPQTRALYCLDTSPNIRPCPSRRKDSLALTDLYLQTTTISSISSPFPRHETSKPTRVSSKTALENLKTALKPKLKLWNNCCVLIFSRIRRSRSIKKNHTAHIRADLHR